MCVYSKVTWCLPLHGNPRPKLQLFGRTLSPSSFTKLVLPIVTWKDFRTTHPAYLTRDQGHSLSMPKVAGRSNRGSDSSIGTSVGAPGVQIRLSTALQRLTTNSDCVQIRATRQLDLSPDSNDPASLQYLTDCSTIVADPNCHPLPRQSLLHHNTWVLNVSPRSSHIPTLKKLQPPLCQRNSDHQGRLIQAQSTTTSTALIFFSPCSYTT